MEAWSGLPRPHFTPLPLYSPFIRFLISHSSPPFLSFSLFPTLSHSPGLPLQVRCRLHHRRRRPLPLQDPGGGQAAGAQVPRAGARRGAQGCPLLLRLPREHERAGAACGRHAEGGGAQRAVGGRARQRRHRHGLGGAGVHRQPRRRHHRRYVHLCVGWVGMYGGRREYLCATRNVHNRCRVGALFIIPTYHHSHPPIPTLPSLFAPVSLFPPLITLPPPGTFVVYRRFIGAEKPHTLHVKMGDA